MYRMYILINMMTSRPICTRDNSEIQINAPLKKDRVSEIC